MKAARTGLPPVLLALFLQGLSLACILAFSSLLAIPLTPLPSAFMCGFLAAILSHFAGMARWWLVIQLFLPPALVTMLGLALPPGYYLGAFLVLLAVYWSSFRSQVPLYLSSRKVWRELEALLPEKGVFDFVDIGSGTGGVLVHLARQRPQGYFYGMETAPLPFLASWLRIRLGGIGNCQIRWESFWLTDLGQYDVVFAYLSPAPMGRLWQKVRNEMRPGTLFVSNTFEVPGQAPERTIEVDDMHHSTLYIWRM